MAVTIPNWIVQQYADMTEHLYQQRFPRLRQYVRTKTGVRGERASFDRLGESEFNEIVDRHGDTVYVDPDHTRRWVSKRDFDHAILLDRQDNLEILVNAQEAYVQNGAMAKARLGDKRILRAVEGNAYQGKDTTTTVALPAGQIVAAGTDGLTPTKFRQARELHSEAEVGLDDLNMGMTESFVAVISPAGMRQMLAETEATSSDFIGSNGQRMPLVNGRIPEYMGYKIVQHNDLTITTGTTRRALFWHMSAVGLAIWEEEFMSIDPLPQKRHSMQIYRSCSMEATRIQDDGVVAVDYDEAA